MNSSPDNATYKSHNTATEFLCAVSDWLQSDISRSLHESPYIAILADEATDIRQRTELSVCFRFVVNGQAVERFFSLMQLKSTSASDIADAMLDLVKKHSIPLRNIYWMAFDGAANMSGTKNGVQAKLRHMGLDQAHYIHCRSHLLNLAAANVANNFKPLRSLFSSFNSVWKFFHNSPKRRNQLTEIEKILGDPVLDLVRAGDTRWTSNYRAVRAVRTCLNAIVVTLQQIHMSGADLSCEAGGLLLTFQNQDSVLLIFALEQILQPLNILTLALQSPKLSLAELPETVSYFNYSAHLFQLLCTPNLLLFSVHVYIGFI